MRRLIPIAAALALALAAMPGPAGGAEDGGW